MNRSTIAAYGTSPDHVDDWREEARCLDFEDPEMWFPVGTTGASVPQIATAVSICHLCPVREECLRYALEHGEEFGIWGGMAEDERRTVKRRNDRERLNEARQRAHLVSA